MNFFKRIEAIRSRWDVLHHPFYERWNCGELSRRDLAVYASEYRHATVALAATAAATAERARGPNRLALEQHAADEAEHVGLWDRFAGAVDAPTGREPEPETAACVTAWTSASDLAEGLVTLYAIEAAQPAIAQTKLDGLVRHYRLADGSPGTIYFSLHAELDHRHAAEARELLEQELPSSDEERLLRRAEATLEANWRLLDGVERVVAA